MLVMICSVLKVCALTCQEYTRGHCVSVGCEVHCDFIGRGSGYCAYGGGGCTCICTGNSRSTLSNFTTWDKTEKQSNEYQALFLFDSAQAHTMPSLM